LALFEINDVQKFTVFFVFGSCTPFPLGQRACSGQRARSGVCVLAHPYHLGFVHQKNIVFLRNTKYKITKMSSFVDTTVILPFLPLIPTGLLVFGKEHKTCL
jgi:hypothetical protein